MIAVGFSFAQCKVKPGKFITFEPHNFSERNLLSRLRGLKL